MKHKQETLLFAPFTLYSIYTHIPAKDHKLKTVLSQAVLQTKHAGKANFDTLSSNHHPHEVAIKDRIGSKKKEIKKRPV